MAETKERSVIFKFFYVLLRIITFPIYFVFLIFRHPLSFFFIILVLICGLIYVPLSEGAKKDEIFDWYKAKYFELKYRVATTAKESGTTEYLPKNMQQEVVKIEKEAQELNRPKSENYNDKVDRVEEVEKITAEVRKRRGFKKKDSSNGGLDEEEMTDDSADNKQDGDNVQPKDGQEPAVSSNDDEEIALPKAEDMVTKPLMPEVPKPEAPEKTDDEFDLF